jgi:divalent metal cation (Fe/Co/Zn/Cd) transporter
MSLDPLAAAIDPLALPLAPCLSPCDVWRQARRSRVSHALGETRTTVCADECCAPPALVLPPKPKGDREALIREAFRLEWLTVGWMSVEAIVALASGLGAGSLVLIAFGLDSVVELTSAGVLVWRLTIELRHGQAFSEIAERLASRTAGGLLFALAAYVTIAALWSLWARQSEGFSWAGFIVALAAIPSMQYLARRKIAIAEKIGSRALRADAMEAVTCGWLSAVVVVSLAAQWAVGAWWIDGLASLAIVWLLVKEGREAWSNKECGCG